MSFLKKRELLIEVSGLSLSILLLAVFLRRMLFYGTTTIIHDALGSYSIFKYFADHILNTDFPYWNYFSHGGEPFYPVLMQARIFEPINILAIYIGNCFTQDSLIIYSWSIFLKLVLMQIGAYFFLRNFCENLLVKLSIIPILFFSSVFIVNFRQDGFFNQFLWTPFLIYAVYELIYNNRSQDTVIWCLAVISFGLSMQSYFFSGPANYLLMFLIGVFIFDRNRFSLFLKSFSDKKVQKNIFISSLFLIFMMIPNILLFFEKDDYIYPARGGFKESSSVVMTYEIIKTGASLQLSDFLNIVYPYLNSFMMKAYPGAGGSEACIYIGVLGFFVVLLGLFLGSNRIKKHFILLLFYCFIVLLGPSIVFYESLFAINPILHFFRNTACLVLFFTFTMMYFFVLGMNYIFSLDKTKYFTISKDLFVLAVFLAVFLYAKSVYNGAFQVIFLIPLLAFIFRYKIISFFGSKSHRFIYGLIMVYLIVDLVSFFKLSNIFYEGQPHLSLYGIKTKITNPYLPRQRQVILPPFRTVSNSQPFFQEILFEKPSMLTNFDKEEYRYLSDFTNEAYFESDRFSKSLFDKMINTQPTTIFFVSKYYGKLIKSDLHPMAFKKFFSVDEDQFKFFESAKSIQNDENILELNNLDISDLENTVNSVVFLNTKEEAYEYVKHSFIVKPLISSNIKSNTQIFLKIDSKKEGFLYWSNGFSPYWKAKINHVDTKIYRANINFMAIKIPKGSSEVEFFYDPIFKYGLYFYTIGFLSGFFTMIATFLIRQRNKRKFFV